MDISHDRDFKKRGNAGRQPAREQVKDTRADQRDTARDFDLRRGRDALSSGEDAGRYRQDQSRRMHTEQADSPITDHAGMDWDAGSGGAGYEAVASQAGHTDRNPPADGVPADRVPSNGTPVHTAARDFDLRRGRGDSASREDLRRYRQNQSRRMHTEQADRKAPDMQEAEFPVHEDIPSDNGGSGISEPRAPEKPGIPFREEPARAGSRRDARNRKEDSGQRAKQRGNKYRQRFQKEAKDEERAASGEAQKKPSKLEFTADELPPEKKDRKLSQAGKKAERTEQKLEQAKERLPSRRKLRMETVSDPETGKAKKHLKLEKEGKTQKAHVKGLLPLRPVKAGANAVTGYAHKKIYEAENENVGIKAAHRTELVGEAGVRTVWYRHKTAPYRRVEKLQKKSVRAKANAAYRQVLHERPELKKNLLARMWQKKKLKRRYAKAAREAQKAGRLAKGTAVTTERIAMGMVRAAKRHPVLCAILLFLLLVFFIIASLISSFSNVGTGGLGSIAASSYLAEDGDIDRAELVYTE